jgi:hypothetical protein
VAVRIDSDDIGGVVSGTKGPEAGVWVIAETADLPTKFAKIVVTAGRHLGVFDPKTQKFTLIDTCFSTHHLVFAEDANNTLWLSSGGSASGVLGWLNTKMFDETGDGRSRRVGRLLFSTPMATASAMTMWSPISRSTRPKINVS